MNAREKNSKILVDCFIFYNELEMLNYRLNVLNNIVDYFVIVESTHTHAGKEKALYFNDNKHIFEKFQEKIVNQLSGSQVEFSFLYLYIRLEYD